MLADAAEHFHLGIAVKLNCQVVLETRFATVTAQLAPSLHLLIHLMVKVANLANVEGRVSVGRVETPEAFRRILQLLLPLCLDLFLQGVLSFWVEKADF